jgi:hypothetical protein
MAKKYSSPEFLDALHSVRWQTVLRTYGNDHSTLIGLLVDWWVRLSPKNFALESGPSFGHLPKGKGRGNCDAIFGENNHAVGVLEVEGPTVERWKWCVEKIKRFFGAERDVFKSLGFAILLTYPYQPRGRGDERKVEPIDREKILSLVKPISKQYPNKGIVVITIDKLFDRGHGGIRALNDYSKCTPKAIWGALLVGGKVVKKRDFVS